MGSQVDRIEALAWRQILRAHNDMQNNFRIGAFISRHTQVPCSGWSEVVQWRSDTAKRGITKQHTVYCDPTTVSTARLFIRHVNLPSIDCIDNVMWRSAVNSAANGLGSAQDFLDASGEILRQ